MKADMDKGGLKTLWLGLMLGFLVATAPTWLNSQASASHYDAPWMPGEVLPMSTLHVDRW